jgi:hypothetical protein
MKSFSRAITTHTLATAALLVLAATASAANLGSTDLWADQFRDSFGAPSASNQTVDAVAEQTGSTDIWSNPFRASFGAAGQQGARSHAVSLTGSTDLWANGFRQSFATPASIASEAVGLGGNAGNSVR